MTFKVPPDLWRDLRAVPFEERDRAMAELRAIAFATAPRRSGRKACTCDSTATATARRLASPVPAPPSVNHRLLSSIKQPTPSTRTLLDRLKAAITPAVLTPTTAQPRVAASSGVPAAPTYAALAARITKGRP